jgi:hypothetical protein
MGATFFRTSYRGKSLSDAYKSAVEDAENEYGHDPYNGTISTTTGFHVIDRTREYKASGKSLEDYINIQSDKLSKRQCAAICIEEPKSNNNKIKTQVEHVVTPGTKKWMLRYVVRHNDHFIGAWPTKGDALKDARRYTEANQVSTTISMEKYLEKGTSTVAKITYKRSDKEKDGRWIFFGWAAE